MKLTRRDALLALAGGGLVASAAVAEDTTDVGDATVSENDLDTLAALAEVLYPSTVTVTDRFLETYVLGRRSVDKQYMIGLNEALDVVRSTSRHETGRSYASLDTALGSDVLRATGADRAYADPQGTVAERIRYYVIDELMYALYTTPKGAALAGNQNPTGYPGGTEAYQQRPRSADE